MHYNPNALFTYKNINTDIHIISSLVRLWREKKLLKREALNEKTGTEENGDKKTENGDRQDNQSP